MTSQFKNTEGAEALRLEGITTEPTNPNIVQLPYNGSGDVKLTLLGPEGESLAMVTIPYTEARKMAMLITSNIL